MTTGLVLVLLISPAIAGDFEDGLASYKRGDFTAAFSAFKKAAEQGDARAQVDLGYMYYNGQGITQDYQQAAYWMRRAAEQGNAVAQTLLGNMYADGQGVTQDYQQAVFWYRKAAEQGDAGAQTLLGFKYLLGMGVAQDYVEAYKWFNIAGAHGDKDAMKEREDLQERMTPAQIAEGQRLAREWKPHLESSVQEDHASPLTDKPKNNQLQLASTGRGFFVSANGDVITNHHVTDKCTQLRITGRDTLVRPTADDTENDIALLATSVHASSVATFRGGHSIRAGDNIVVIGYPLRGLLANEANVSTGTVSALAGMGNDTRFIQITAPVQPGNSGGPLLDEDGHVVGVVVAKLDAIKIAKVTGDIPQNINFAIKGNVAQSFLDANGIVYSTAESKRKLETAEIVSQAKSYTVVIECWR